MSGTELKTASDVGQGVGHDDDTAEFVSVMWMTKEQAALHFGVSSRTVERRSKKHGWDVDTSSTPKRYGIPSDAPTSRDNLSGTTTTRVGHDEEMSDSVADVPDIDARRVGHASETVGRGGDSVSGTIAISVTREAELLGRLAAMSDTVERVVGQLDRQMEVSARQVSVIQDAMSDRDAMMSVIASQQRMIETKDSELRVLRPAPDPQPAASGVTIRGAKRRRWWRLGG